jgi:hypothetical protein
MLYMPQFAPFMTLELFPRETLFLLTPAPKASPVSTGARRHKLLREFYWA